MTYVHDKETRSYNMSMIKGENTRPEFIVRKFLHCNGYIYRLHYSKLASNLDIVLPKYRTAAYKQIGNAGPPLMTEKSH